MTFCLVVPDHLDLEGHAGSKEGWPGLPALGRLLATSIAHRLDNGWRAGLLRDTGWPQAMAMAPASIAAWSLQAATTGPAVAFAEPVHQVAGMSRVHLHPRGLLRLSESEAAQLCDTFERDLGEDGPRLRLAGIQLLIAGELGETQDSGEAQEPARFLGRELASAGERISSTLRRLGAEVEMWLQEHPVNRAREARGDLTVNALWFWGAAPVESVPVPQGAAAPGAVYGGIAYGEDAFLAGLWSALRGELRPAVTGYGQVRESAACVVVGAAQADATRLDQLENAWFEPLLEAIESRRIQALRLRLGRHCWDIRRQGMTRWWRRPGPWWEHFTT